MTGIAQHIAVTCIEPGTPEYAEAARLRYDALYREWGLPRSLTDDADAHVFHHYVARDRDRIVGYARIDLATEECQIYQVSVARDRRGEGIGAMLVGELVAVAREAGRDAVHLDARVHVIGFYERLGFEAIGEEFLSKRTHTPHRRMRRTLAGDPADGCG